MKNNKKVSNLSSEEIEYLKRLNAFSEFFSELENSIAEIEEVEIKDSLFLDEDNSVSFNQTLGEITRKINNSFCEIMTFSDEHNLYWQFCNEKTYKSKLNKFRSKLNPKTGIEIIDILEDELNFYTKTKKYEIVNNNRPFFNNSFYGIDFQKYLYKENKYKIKALTRNIINVLKLEIAKEGFDIEVVGNEINLTKTIKDNISNDISPTEESITLKDLPSFDTLDRFELLKTLNFDSKIHNLVTSQKSKYKVLALIMKIHPETARKLMTNKYPKLKSKEEIAELCAEAKNNVNIFFNNPINNIKIP